MFGWLVVYFVSFSFLWGYSFLFLCSYFLYLLRTVWSRGIHRSSNWNSWGRSVRFLANLWKFWGFIPSSVFLRFFSGVALLNLCFTLLFAFLCSTVIWGTLIWFLLSAFISVRYLLRNCYFIFIVWLCYFVVFLFFDFLIFWIDRWLLDCWVWISYWFNLFFLVGNLLLFFFIFYWRWFWTFPLRFWFDSGHRKCFIVCSCLCWGCFLRPLFRRICRGGT